VQPGLGEVNSLAPEGHPFAPQPLSLIFTLGDGPVGAHHAVPRELLMSAGQYAADHPRCSPVDIAVRAHKPFRDGADALDDERFASFRRQGSANGRLAPSLYLAH
jgi:hypothetical protein